MARGTTLGELVDMLRYEAGRSANVSSGVDNRDAEKHLLRRTQEELYFRWDWPFLRVDPYKSLDKDNQWYDVPSGVNLERIEAVYSWWNGDPRPIDRGIGVAEYAEFDTDNGESSDPVLKWDIKYNPGTATEQIEVWPLPNSNDQRLQFFGLRPLNALTEEEDTADLDDVLIVLFAASEVLGRQKSQDAQIKLARAEQRFADIKKRYMGGSDMAIYGGGKPRRRTGRTIVRVSG
jgi:hypothetical protein